MRDQQGYSRNSDGTFDPETGVGSRADQRKAGVNLDDTHDSASSKVFWTGVRKQPTNPTGDAAAVYDGAALDGAKIVFLALIVCLFLYTTYRTFHAFVAGAAHSGSSFQAPTGYLEFPPEFLNPPEMPITNGVTADFARVEFIDKAKTFLSNPAAIDRLADSCAQACAQPSSAEMLKYLRYVKPGQLQNFLRFACQKDESNNLYMGGYYNMPKFTGNVILSVTPSGCRIENYENFKTVRDSMQSGYQKGIEADTAKLRKGGVADALKYGALLIIELTVIVFVGKRWLKSRRK